jgi:hypothetical protein
MWRRLASTRHEVDLRDRHCVVIDKDCTFVLGAQDLEMREIERVLDSAARACVHAARGLRRATSRTAYEADGVVRVGSDLIPRSALLLPKAPVVFVECRLPGREPVVRVDHHNPGDPGYDAGPARYLEGSSLGQVLALLESEPTQTQRLLAAGDHCLTAAYQGACQGADPNELLELRAAWQARMSGRTLSDVIGGILRRPSECELTMTASSESPASSTRPTCRWTWPKARRTPACRCATAR